MGISLALAESHVNTWTEILFPRKKSWPCSIFHACHVTTAAQILNSHEIICRRNLGAVGHDVANQGALHNNNETHAFCRFYFRPRNNYHLKTEGIKTIGDRYRDEFHMSVPIFFVFDAIRILSRDDTRFTLGPGSRSAEEIGNGDDFFRRYQFRSVYHDEPTNGTERDAIHAWRMAEVLIPNNLQLLNNLRNIVCRTHLDIETLRTHVHPQIWERYKALIIVEQIGGSCFLHRGANIESIYFDNENNFRLSLKLAEVPPVAGYYKLKIRLMERGQEKDYRLSQAARGPWRFRIPEISLQPNELIEIYLEDVLAYRGTVSANVSLI